MIYAKNMVLLLLMEKKESTRTRAANKKQSCKYELYIGLIGVMKENI